MKSPCADCPFRTDRPAFIREARGREIDRLVISGDGFFPCHLTVDYSEQDDLGEDGRITADSKWCVGALLLMEHEHEDSCGAMRNQMVRIHTRLGGLDLDALDQDAAVPASVSEWLDFLREGER